MINTQVVGNPSEQFIKLRQIVLPVLQPYGVKRVAVFGSFARGEQTTESDIDILVDLDEPRRRPLGLLTWTRLERELSEKIGRKVELVTNQGLNRHIRPFIEADMVIIYEET